MKKKAYTDYYVEEVLPKDHFLFASESVGEGHPDKLCDQISDAVLDACLKLDPDAKVACESTAKGNKFHVLGEITVRGEISYPDIVKKAVIDAGFNSDEKGLDGKKIEVFSVIEQQQPEIAEAVHLKKAESDMAAGDQGLMFGYATSEWDEEILMPFSHHLASRLCERLSVCRNTKVLPWLRPDCKSQVTVEYQKIASKIIPLRIHNIVISTQHDPDVKLEDLRKGIMDEVVNVVCPKKYIDARTMYFINPSKSFVIGGPVADAGLTGRKTIVDTYGGWAPHGGGAFSGKDPSKVDRSATYYLRYVAKSLVHAKLCQRVLVQVSYAIGMADPLSIYVDSYGSAKEGLTDYDLTKIVKKNFNFRPGNMIAELKLKRPIYQKTASYGHFGRVIPEFTWEYPKEPLNLT
jgi:S-adenosylmethionine synthetase